MKKHYRTPEAAEFTQTSESYLEKLRVTGGGPRFAKLGKTVIYDQLDLEEWIESRKRSSTSE